MCHVCNHLSGHIIYTWEQSNARLGSDTYMYAYHEQMSMEKQNELIGELMHSKLFNINSYKVQEKIRVPWQSNVARPYSKISNPSILLQL